MNILQDFHICISAPLIIIKVRKSTEDIGPVETCFKLFKDYIAFVTHNKKRRKSKKTQR